MFWILLFAALGNFNLDVSPEELVALRGQVHSISIEGCKAMLDLDLDRASHDCYGRCRSGGSNIYWEGYLRAYAESCHPDRLELLSVDLKTRFDNGEYFQLEDLRHVFGWTQVSELPALLRGVALSSYKSDILFLQTEHGFDMSKRYMDQVDNLVQEHNWSCGGPDSDFISDMVKMAEFLELPDDVLIWNRNRADEIFYDLECECGGGYGLNPFVAYPLYKEIGDKKFAREAAVAAGEYYLDSFTTSRRRSDDVMSGGCDNPVILEEALIWFCKELDEKETFTILGKVRPPYEEPLKNEVQSRQKLRARMELPLCAN